MGGGPPERGGSSALFKHEFCSKTLKHGSGVGGRLWVVFQFESQTQNLIVLCGRAAVVPRDVGCNINHDIGRVKGPSVTGHKKRGRSTKYTEVQTRPF